MQSLLQKIVKHCQDPPLIERAFVFAKEAYGDRKRVFGESYLDHALHVALILSDMQLDDKTVIAGILHDTADIAQPDDKKKMLDKIARQFGREIANIIEKSSELNKIYYSTRRTLQEEYALSAQNTENLRKMFLAIAQDLRVILIDLASRVDGLTKIKNLSEKMQKTYATETLEIFVPIANRLGLGEIKTKMEDLAFAHLDPEKFLWLKEQIRERYEERQRYLKKFIPRLKKIFKAERIGFLDINYRAKSYWSCYQKLLRKNMDLEKIHDLVALRIIVKDVEACYKALGIIHKHFKPISSEEINDYIARPKSNGYKSLHTTVFLENDRISEIQIRTQEMQKEAECGVCAHWSYKENINLHQNPEHLRLAKEVPGFWKTFAVDFFAGQIFAFTPKGDVVMLPKGSTPVDFAYAIHSEIGSRCESAKIGGKIIPLSETLRNGDVVEIITNKKRGPSQDWLKFVKTGFAKSHIKKSTTEKVVSSIFSIPAFITRKIFDISGKVAKVPQRILPAKKDGPSHIYLAGQRGMLVNVAKCCSPQPGDLAKAYLTKHRAAVLHKTSCQNLQKLADKFPEKIIDASWK